jgi:hypothetical protein
LALGSGAAPIDFIWEIYDAAREASFEAKESGESRDGIGSRWGFVAGGWRIRGSRRSACPCQRPQTARRMSEQPDIF